jgi:hypothetical protein
MFKRVAFTVYPVTEMAEARTFYAIIQRQLNRDA